MSNDSEQPSADYDAPCPTGHTNGIAVGCDYCTRQYFARRARVTPPAVTATPEASA